MMAPNTDLENHWIHKLKEYDNHKLTKVLADFKGDLFSFLLSSYIYLGETKQQRKFKRKIVVIHYHSSLMGPLKFFDMQNISSYQAIPNVTKADIAHLSTDITSENVTLLAFPNALEHNSLKFIEQAKALVLCDECGRVKEYDI